MSVTEEKEPRSKPLYGMFNAIPRHYDLINRLITCGLDSGWRETAARQCLAAGPSRVLDLGCGTGDLAIDIVRMTKVYVHVTGFDYSPLMLELARRKADLAVGKDKITFTRGEAASLPFADGYFDCVGISFAFRNLTYKNPLVTFHLAEVYRVLRPGGRFVIVESSQPASRVIRWFFHAYLRWFVYPVGYRVSGNKSAYKYLTESAARYYSPTEVRGLLKSVGFREVSYRPLLLGAAGIHIATK